MKCLHRHKASQELTINFPCGGVRCVVFLHHNFCVTLGPQTPRSTTSPKSLHTRPQDCRRKSRKGLALQNLLKVHRVYNDAMVSKMMC